jgi:hypothetical protein
MKKNKKIISLLASLAIMSAMGTMTVGAEFNPALYRMMNSMMYMEDSLTTAERRIQNIDMAAEMVFNKTDTDDKTDTDNDISDILRKAAEQMLSQAHSGTPQTVLLLLDDGPPITTTISPTTNPTTKFPLPALTVTPNNTSPETIKNFEKLSLKISEPDNSFNFEDCTTKTGMTINIVQ